MSFINWKSQKQVFFKEATKGGVISNRNFWKTVKPFLTNKCCMTNDCISTERDENRTDSEQDDVTFTDYKMQKNAKFTKCSAHPSVHEIKKEFSSDKEFEKVQTELLLNSIKYRPILLIVIL